jgi:hypothetical protein
MNREPDPARAHRRRTGRILVTVGMAVSLLGLLTLFFVALRRFSSGLPFWGWGVLGLGLVLAGLALRFAGRSMLWGAGPYGRAGGPVGGPAPPGLRRQCPSCRRWTGPGASFCPHCGTTLPGRSPA